MEVLFFIIAVIFGISIGYIVFRINESNSNLQYGIEIIKSELVNLHLKIENVLKQKK